MSLMVLLWRCLPPAPYRYVSKEMRGQLSNAVKASNKRDALPPATPLLLDGGHKVRPNGNGMGLSKSYYAIRRKK